MKRHNEFNSGNDVACSYAGGSCYNAAYCTALSRILLKEALLVRYPADDSLKQEVNSILADIPSDCTRYEELQGHAQ